MKKILKFGLPLIIALVMVFTLAGSVLAYDPDEVDVDIDITGPDSGYQGDEVTVTATVTVTAVDEDSCYKNEEAYSESGYQVEDPNGIIIDGDSEGLFDSGYFGADASFIYEWLITFTLEELGDYDVDVYGLALADLFLFWWDDCDFGEETFTVESLLRPHYCNWFNNGQFELVIMDLCKYHSGYDYDEESGLVPDVVQYGPTPTASGIRIDIPAGTVVTDENGDPVLQLTVICHNEYGVEPYLEVTKPNAGSQQGEVHFSQPVVVTKPLSGGALQEIVTFTDVIGGIVPIP
jgi:hypothetical protein